MRFFKIAFLSIFGGLIFAIVSFVLITTYLRGNFPAILFWGFQGFLFSLAYFLIEKLIFQNNSKGILKSTILGGASGLISTSFNIVITIQDFFNHDPTLNVVIPDQLVRNLYFELSLYAIGCLIFGMIIGVVIGYKSNYRITNT